MAQDQERFRNYLQVVGTIIAILAAVVPGVIWTVNHFGGDNHPAAAGPVQNATDAPTTVPTTPVGATPGAAAQQVFLDSLTPDTGTTNLSALPRALSGRPGYEHAVTLPCGSNNTGDTKRVVSYLLEKRYVSLSADVRSYKEKPDEYKVQIRFYADNQQPQAVELGVNEQQPFTMPVDGVKKLTLELTCERPGAVVMLANARIEHA